MPQAAAGQEPTLGRRGSSCRFNETQQEGGWGGLCGRCCPRSLGRSCPETGGSRSRICCECLVSCHF